MPPGDAPKVRARILLEWTDTWGEKEATLFISLVKEHLLERYPEVVIQDYVEKNPPKEEL